MNVRRIINMLFLGEKELTDKLLQIVDETEYFVRSYEMPGVVKRWKRINEKLLFFDAAFTVMENTPEVYKTISKGQTDITFACYPDEELIKERKRYFEQVREKNETNNFRYSEERIFLNELLHTLKMVFEADFAEYL